MTSALHLFRSNNDTVQIAAFLGIDEHEAYNMLAREREEERERDIKLNWRTRAVSRDGKIAYAGAEL